MSTCVYSIGSNQGDRLALLQGAVDSLRPWLVAVSPVYQSDVMLNPGANKSTHGP